MSTISKLRATLGLVLLTLALAQGAAARQAEARPLYRLWLPGERWALDLDLSAFNLPAGNTSAADAQKRPLLFAGSTEHFSEDGNGLWLSSFGKPGGKSDSAPVFLLVKFTRALAPGTAADFRDYVLDNLSKKVSGNVRLKDSAKTSEYKGIPVARYAFVSETSVLSNFYLGPNTITSSWRTLEAYQVRDGYWITVTLRARELKEREEALFNSLLDSLRVTDVSAPSTSFDYYHKGRVHFLTKDYERAVDALAVALTLEHKQRRLDQASWRDLVCNLIDSLARSGDVTRAKEAMDYAVAQDPNYPRFQLALARYYASVGDLDNTIAYLERAFRKDAAGEWPLLPDPKDDPAFERFRKDERFRKAVKGLKK
jgi:tetratricopeptide (TPR) repeat protein